MEHTNLLGDDTAGYEKLGGGQYSASHQVPKRVSHHPRDVYDPVEHTNVCDATDGIGHTNVSHTTRVVGRGAEDEVPPGRRVLRLLRPAEGGGGGEGEVFENSLLLGSRVSR